MIQRERFGLSTERGRKLARPAGIAARGAGGECHRGRGCCSDDRARSHHGARLQLSEAGARPPLPEHLPRAVPARQFFERADLRKASLAVEAVRRIDEIFAIERGINGRSPSGSSSTTPPRKPPLIGKRGLLDEYRMTGEDLMRHAQRSGRQVGRLVLRLVLLGSMAAVLLLADIAVGAGQELRAGGRPIPPLRRGANGQIEVVPPAAVAPTRPRASSTRTITAPKLHARVAGETAGGSAVSGYRGPCDLILGGCATMHSVARAMVSTYSRNLFQLVRISDNRTSRCRSTQSRG